MKVLLLGVSLFVILSGSALADAITARAATVDGMAKVMQPGATTFSTLRQGDYVSVGSVVKTEAAAVVALLTVPGSCVVMAEGTQTGLEHLQFERAGGTIHSREATSRLENGSLFFGLENLNPKVTRFEVKTPRGNVSAHGTSGTVDVKPDRVSVTATSGHVGFGQWTLTPGSFLVMTDRNAEITDGIANLFSVYDEAGKLVEQRAATRAELEQARGSFAVAVKMAARAVAAGTLGRPFVGEVVATLTELNRSLVTAGLAPVEWEFATMNVSSAHAPAASGHMPLPSASGIEDMPANPANLSGSVQSPEK